MIYYSVTQMRLPEHFGWEVCVRAYLDFELVDEIGIPPEHEDRISQAYDAHFDSDRELRTPRTEHGLEIACLKGILLKNFIAFDEDQLSETMKKETQIGSGTFDAMGGAHIAAKFLADWLNTEACVDFIDWENFRPAAIFACDEIVCAPGVKLHSILCRLLAELEAYVGPMESILAVHQEFSIEDLSNHQAHKHFTDFVEVSKFAEQHGFRATLAGKGSRLEGRKMKVETHLGFERAPAPNDLATTVFALEGSEFNNSNLLWPADDYGESDLTTLYMDPVTWIEHELGLQEHPRPAGSDIPHDERRRPA